MATLLQLFADQRREDRQEAAEQRQEAAEQRREDRREAAERKARLEARLLQPSSPVAYLSGGQGVPPVRGEGGWGELHPGVRRLLGTHEVPVAHWPRELSLKLKGSAANWYAARFPDLPTGTFPLWSELHAAMLHAYSPSYGAQ